ncbi:hypothetical protein Ndes2526B_g03759 [Nannochloris sp. 'desiccata']|nr:hypothetical protein KSW81_005380 [Chlorella desiccata (nom. nud.)]KAH7621410.1 putative Sucrose nonfermenting 4-like protein [Chlorella desiccata (nom. nud.)]
MSLFVPTKFVWRFGGSQVHLCGSFTRWVETVPMTPVEGQSGTFSVIVHLPPGYHQYKFIVDGEWRHDETQPFMPDPLGNVNNWLFVRKPEPSQPAESSLHQQLQQQQMAHQAAHQISQGSGGGGPGGHPAIPPPFPSSPGKSSMQSPIPPPILHPAAMHASPSPPPITSPVDMEMTTANTIHRGGGGAGIGGGHTGDSASTSGVDGVLAPIAAQVEEPQYTRRKVKEFLAHHSAYELIPESGKVVLLDIDLPLRQAFHALHEQGLASAPLYCSESGTIAGIVSASDFIATLQRLRSMVSTSSNPMSEQEMDQHTIRGLREEMEAEGRPPKALVCVAPGNSLAQVVRTMYENHCSMAPVLQHGPNGHLVRDGNLGGGGSGGGGGSTSASAAAAAAAAGGDDCDGPEVLHTASLAGVLACLMRHFRASLASLPLLAQPLHSLPVGTWNPESPVAQQATGLEEPQPAIDGVQRRGRRIVPIKVVHHTTPLNEAMGLLIEAGISCLPVVDDSGALIDIYARSDVTMLAKSNAYSRLQFEDVTVGQALALTAEPGPPPQLSVTQPAAPPQWPSPNSSSTSMHDAAMAASSRQRVHVCTSQDALRFVVDRLATPGVRRVFVVHAETRRVEGIVSLSDVASFMLV